MRQIGDVADLLGLSLRTIRYYGEVGLAPPSARSEGGFRLYSDRDVARLRLIMQMKPLGFSLEQMRDHLATLDELADTRPTSGQRGELVERLAMFHRDATTRVAVLREQLDAATGFADGLAAELEQHR